MFVDNKTQDNKISYLDQESFSFKWGITLQREKFKECKFSNNFDGMCDSIENIKAEIAILAEKKGFDEIKKISKICKWYRYREIIYSKRTPEGNQVVFPLGFNNIVNHKLTYAYELIINLLNKLDLL